jgi:large subunit ribosomal protein L24
MKLRQGDKVKVVAGKDRGKESRIERVFPKSNKILVEGVNTAKKHQKTDPNQPNSGGIVDRDMPIDASNVMIVCSKCGPTRIGAKIDAKGKHRVCAKCGGAL